MKKPCGACTSAMAPAMIAAIPAAVTRERRPTARATAPSGSPTMTRNATGAGIPARVHALHPHRRHVPAKVRALVEILATRFARPPWRAASSGARS